MLFSQLEVKYFEGGYLTTNDLINYTRKEIIPKNDSKPYHKLTYDIRGRIVSIEGFENNVKSSLDHGLYSEIEGSVVKYQFSYYKNETEIVFFNEQNKQIESGYGEKHNKIKIFRSEKSDTITVSYIKSKYFFWLDNYDVPFIINTQSDGISRSIRFVYENKNLIEETHLDDQNNITNNISGYAQIKFMFDNYGRLLSQVTTDYLGNIKESRKDIYSNNLLTSSIAYSKEGIKSEKNFQYINQDTIVNQLWVDSSNLRINKPNSNIGSTKIHLKIGEKITTYFDLKGNPIIYIDEELTTCECARKIERFHLKDSIEETYFGLANNQIKKTVRLLVENSVLSDNVTYKFDQNGNILEEKYIDSLGNPKQDYYKSYKKIYKRTSSGLITQVLSYGINEELIGNSVRKEFDSLGRIISISYLDNFGNLTSDGRLGFAKYTYKYDSIGNILEYKTYGIDNTLMANVNGIAYYKYNYDSKNNLIELKVYDNLIETYENEEIAKPISTMKFNYNLLDSSYLVEEYGFNGEMVKKEKFNNKKRLIQQFYFDEKCGELHQIFQTEIGKDGKTINTRYFIYNKKCVLKGQYVYRGKSWEDISIESIQKDNNAAGCKINDSKENKYYVRIKMKQIKYIPVL